ncbi:MAG: hypothetical protein OXD01_04955 [Gammaproteobacteria bacterium]|nr:hypothetical protein [Gammaproteobacteria bacterium]
MSTFLLYCFLVLPQVAGFIYFMSACFMIFGIAGIILTLVIEDDYNKNNHSKIKGHRKKLIYLFFAGLVFSVAAAFVPSTEKMAILIAWELGTSVDGIENIPARVVEYLNSYLTTSLNEFTEIN